MTTTTTLTLSAAANATAPAAFTGIASLASNPPAGIYRVRCYGGYNSGVPGAAESASGGNIGFYVGAVSHALGIAPIVGTPQGPFTFDIMLDGNTALSVGTLGNAGTAAVVYDCALFVDPVHYT